MRYVLDCSVALKWFVPEPLSEEAREVLRQHQAGAVTLLAPEIILAEFGHALRKRVSSRDLSRQQASEIWNHFLSVEIEAVPTRSLAQVAFPLALDNMATFYDALYVALAVREECRVLTADERMVNAFASLDRTASLASFR